jgi:hypothetical protein
VQVKKKENPESLSFTEEKKNHQKHPQKNEHFAGSSIFIGLLASPNFKNF